MESICLLARSFAHKHAYTPSAKWAVWFCVHRLQKWDACMKLIFNAWKLPSSESIFDGKQWRQPISTDIHFISQWVLSLEHLFLLYFVLFCWIMQFDIDDEFRKHYTNILLANICSKAINYLIFLFFRCFRRKLICFCAVIRKSLWETIFIHRFDFVLASRWRARDILKQKHICEHILPSNSLNTSHSISRLMYTIYDFDKWIDPCYMPIYLITDEVKFDSRFLSFMPFISLLL